MFSRFLVKTFISSILPFIYTAGYAQQPDLVFQSSHTENITDIIFSEDDSRLISAASDHSVKVWDIPSRKLFRTIEGLTNDLVQGGSSNIIVIYQEGFIRFFDVYTGTLVKQVVDSTFDSYYSYRIFSDPKNNRLFMNRKEYTGQLSIAIRDLTSGRILKSHQLVHKEETNPVSIEIDPVSGRVYFAYHNGDVVIYSPESGGFEQMRLNQGMASLRLNGAFLCALTDNGKVDVYDKDTGKELNSTTVTENGEFFYRLDHPLGLFSNGDFFFVNETAGLDREIIAGGAGNGFDRKVVDDEADRVVISHDEQMVACAFDTDIIIYRREDLQNLVEFNNKYVWYSSLAIPDNHSGIIYSSGLHGNYIYLWDLSKGTMRLIDTQSTISDMDVDDNGELAIAQYAETRFYEYLIDSLSAKKVAVKNWKTSNPRMAGVVRPGSWSISYDNGKLVTEDAIVCGVKLWQKEGTKLLGAVKLAPDDHIVEHLDYREDLNMALVETSNNYHSDYMTYLVDFNREKVIMKIPGNRSSRFIPDKRKAFVPGGILDLDTQKIEAAFGEEESSSGIQWDPSIWSWGITYTFDPAGEGIYIFDEDTIYYNGFNGAIEVIGYHKNVESIEMQRKSNRLISAGKDGQIKIWDLAEKELVATLIAKEKVGWSTNDDIELLYLIVTPDGYFMGSRNAYEMMGYRWAGKAYSFEQFDMIYNRPDIVLQRLGFANDETLRSYQLAFEKRSGIQAFSDIGKATQIRLEVSNRNQIPIRTDQGKVKLSLVASSKSGNLDSYNIWIDGVAMYGSQGKKLPPGTSDIKVDENVMLNPGNNLIEISFRDDSGVESIREIVQVENAKEPESSDLYFVGIGISHYQDGNYNLDYATKDVKDMISFYSSSTYFENVHTLTLTDEQVTSARLDEIEKFLEDSQISDQVVVFYAGHGLLSDTRDYFLSTYDLDFSDPATNGIAIEELERVLESSLSRDKMMLIDACNSGLVDRTSTTEVAYEDQDLGRVNSKRGVQGVATIPDQEEAFELMTATFMNLNRGSGINIVSAAAGSQFAYESSDYNNGLFTWSYLDGIKSGKADGNEDGVIQLSEIKAYVEDKVYRLSEGRQRPTNRQLNYYNDFVIWKTGDSEIEQFLLAARYNNLNRLNYYLDTGLGVNDADKSGFTALHYAAREGQFEAAEFLISKGADVNPQTTPFKWTPLHLAAINNKLRLCMLLVSNGADDQLQDSGNLTPQMSATQKGHQETAQFFNDKDFWLRLYDLTKAAQIGDTLQIRNLLNTGLDPNLNDGQWAPIHYAVSFNRRDATAQLILAGANVNLTGNQQWTPMHVAAVKGSLSSAILLYEKGADLDVAGEYGHTPASLAKSNRQSGMISFLEDPEGTSRSFYDIRKLMRAASLGNLDSLNFYLGSGLVDAGIKDLENGFTALHFAAYQGQIEAIKVIEEYGVDVDIRSENEVTPLMMAALNGQLECVKYLVTRGADIKAKIPSGESVRELAYHSGKTNIVNYIDSLAGQR